MKLIKVYLIYHESSILQSLDLNDILTDIVKSNYLLFQWSIWSKIDNHKQEYRLSFISALNNNKEKIRQCFYYFDQ